MSAFIPFTRTPFSTLFLRRVPPLLAWATAITTVLYWPSIFPLLENHRNNVPKVNCNVVIGSKSIY
jgi:hypothetical protein